MISKSQRRTMYGIRMPGGFFAILHIYWTSGSELFVIVWLALWITVKWKVSKITVFTDCSTCWTLVF